MSGPRILLYDIETRPLEVYVFDRFNQNIGLNQIKRDQGLMAWSAKWWDSKEVIYQDLRNAKDVYNDKPLLDGIWKLLDQADIVVTQNGKAFDQKRLYRHFIINGYKRPSPSRHIDTKIIAKNFGFTSSSLAHLTEVLDTKHKKLEHKKYPGMELWTECLNGNQDAWREMERYNKHDVLALENVYEKFSSWYPTVDFNLYSDEEAHICNCGSREFERRGYSYTLAGKFQRYQCAKCGAWSRGNKNLFTKEKKASLRRGVADG